MFVLLIAILMVAAVALFAVWQRHASAPIVEARPAPCVFTRTGEDTWCYMGGRPALGHLEGVAPMGQQRYIKWLVHSDGYVLYHGYHNGTVALYKVEYVGGNTYVRCLG